MVPGEVMYHIDLSAADIEGARYAILPGDPGRVLTYSGIIREIWGGKMGIDAATLGVPLYFGLLSGATLGGNCTPIGASANITGIGILRREGYEVKNSDFFKIGIPFTLAAIVPAYIYIWLIYGV